MASSSSAARSPAGTTAFRVGRPRVRVPVLSTTMVSTFSSRSSAAASLISTPACAPRPTPTMIDIGVARPSAQGQAMIRTETAATSAKGKAGAGPNTSQATKARIATAITIGTNQEATLSARPWIGARLRCACATICTMRDSMVSAPTCSARITRAPVPLMVPPISRWPAAFSTGTGSPVTMLSSTELWPSTTSPSTGTLSPGRTRRRSPTATWSRATSSSSAPSRMRRAVFGARSSSARNAAPVRCRARSSSTWPSRTRAMITAAASK